MPELVGGSNRGRAHGPVFVSPLRPRQAAFAVNPQCESHPTFSMLQLRRGGENCACAEILMCEDTCPAAGVIAQFEKDLRGTSCPVCNALPETRPSNLNGTAHRAYASIPKWSRVASRTFRVGVIRHR